MLPSDYNAVVKILTTEARDGLTRFKESEGAAEAALVVEVFGRRLADLGQMFARGAIPAQDVARALDSERKALALNLATVAHHHKRAFLFGLLETGLQFLAKLFARP